MRPNRVHAGPGTLLFALVGLAAMAGGQLLVVAAVAATNALRGVEGGGSAWAASHPLIAAGASWILLVPTIRLLGGWLAASSGEDFGIRRSGRVGLAIGLVGGAAMLLLAAVAGALLDGYAPAPSAVVTGAAALPAIAVTLPLLAVLAFGEELLFRGFLMRYWRGLGSRGALVATSGAFALVHAANPEASIPGAVGVILAGLTLGVARMATGSLWLPTGIHLGWNAATAMVLGLPVSGFELPSLVRWTTAEGPWARGLLGGGFGPEEGLAYHAAWVVAMLGVLAVAPLLAPAQEGPPSSRGEADTAERSPGSSSPR